MSLVRDPLFGASSSLVSRTRAAEPLLGHRVTRPGVVIDWLTVQIGRKVEQPGRRGRSWAPAVGGGGRPGLQVARRCSVNVHADARRETLPERDLKRKRKEEKNPRKFEEDDGKEENCSTR